MIKRSISQIHMCVHRARPKGLGVRRQLRASCSVLHGRAPGTRSWDTPPPGCQQVPPERGLLDSGPWGHRRESRSHPRVSSPQSLSTNVLVGSVQNAERMVIELFFTMKPSVPYLTTDLEQF